MAHFTIKRSPIWRPILALLGATARRSWVEVGPLDLTAQFGFYQIRVRRENIDSAERTRWPFWAGIGWRSNFGSTLGLIGATSPVVRIHLREPQRGRLLFIPIRFSDLYLSLDDPDGFIRALEP